MLEFGLLVFLVGYAGPALLHYVAHRVRLERERSGLDVDRLV